jgi:hypothetical protein
MTVAGDFDGDGQLELIMPIQLFMQQLGALSRQATAAQGVSTAWSLELVNKLTTNLAAVPLPGGGIALGAGRDDGVLLIWGAP